MRIFILCMVLFNVVYAEKIALLIGNNDYSFQPLDNPLNDVNGIYHTLRGIGFKQANIKVLKNASKIEMETALANFSQRATRAEIALVYFSGHGMQVNNTNYMFPARTEAKKPVDLFGLVDLEYFIQSASSAKYGIILVDACRNNPLVKYFQNGKHKGSTAKKGLGPVTPTIGQVVIGFATSAGDTADDGSGSMSPYATALAQRLREANRDITKVLGLVALDVSSKHNQHPILRTNLAYDVCLVGSCFQKVHSDDEENKRLRERIALLEQQQQARVVQPTQPVVIEVPRRIDSSTTNTKGITQIGNLMYQNQPFTQRYTWDEAKSYCRDLTLGGYSDWRLPKRAELNRISNIKMYGTYDSGWRDWFDKNKHKGLKGSKGKERFVREEFLENMQTGSYFWTSETYGKGSSYAWNVFFNVGDDIWSSKSFKGYALCIRGQ